jgi:hypothetical protein
VTGAAGRGLRNPFRSRVRAGVVVVLLALVTGFLALMVQAALSSRDQIARLDAHVRTLVELREAGAFGTGGFGGDKPVVSTTSPSIRSSVFAAFRMRLTSRKSRSTSTRHRSIRRSPTPTPW